MKRKATEISIAHTNFDLKGFPYLEFHLNKMLLTIIIQKQIITKIANRKYYRGINSFFQINNTLTKDLYDKVLETVKEKKYIK